MPLGSTMVVVALSDLERDLGVGVGVAALWLVSGYLVVSAVCQPAGGRLGDRLGHRRAFIGGLTAFVSASAIAAAAPVFAVLVAARVAQAASGALMVPNTLALLRAMTPLGRRGRAFGWSGWRWASARRSVPPWPADWSGPSAGGRPSSSTCRSAPSPSPRSTRAPGRLPALVPLPARGSARRHARDLLRRLPFVSAAVTILAENFVLYGLLLMIPLLAEHRLGLSVSQAGLLLAALTGPLLVAGPLGGMLGDRVGRRAPALLGGALIAIGTFGVLAVLPRPSVAACAALLAAAGAGLGVAGASLQASAVEAAPSEAIGLAGGLYTTSRYLGGVAAVALVAALGPGRAFDRASAVLAAAAVVGLLASLGLPARPLRTGARRPS